MKRTMVILAAMFLAFGVAGVGNAALWDRGGGLIYDDVLKVTWLQDANYSKTELNDARVNEIIAAVGSVNGYTLSTWDFKKENATDYTGGMTWQGAMAWADQLVYGGFSNWRLPRALPVNGISYNFNNGVWTYDGSSDLGYNISAPGSAYPFATNSELAYMYYNNLGRKSSYDFNGNNNPEWTSNPNVSFESGGQGGNLVSFLNLHPNDYWSGTAYPQDTDLAFGFQFGLGYQRSDIGGNFAWAVHDGDIAGPVPVPATVLLFGSGLASLAAFRRRFRKN